MPSLKDLKNRIASVKSTRKITSAMKMVAASKLRRAQEQAESARPYARFVLRMLSDLAAGVERTSESSLLLLGREKGATVLLVVMTSDRGLCGAFNGSIVRETRRRIAALEREGKVVRLVCVGRKAYSLLHREHEEKILYKVESAAKKQIEVSDAQALADRLVAMFEEGAFDTAFIVFNRFKSAISQIVSIEQIIPFVAEDGPDPEKGGDGAAPLCEIFEPEQSVLLEALLRRNLTAHLFAALLESAAGEQGARMTAMDNATRNAGDMIDRLTLNYNRSRQAYITKELIEIISGAEAV